MSSPRRRTKRAATDAKATAEPGWPALDDGVFFGPAARLGQVCATIQRLHRHPQVREDLARDMREELGAWLASATPKDLRLLARWRENPEWDWAWEQLHLGIEMEVQHRCLKEAADKAGGAAAFFAASEAQRQHLLREALSPANKRKVLRQIPLEELQRAIERAQMGKHSLDAIRKAKSRKFRATRDKPGRPPKVKPDNAPA